MCAIKKTTRKKKKKSFRCQKIRNKLNDGISLRHRVLSFKTMCKRKEEARNCSIKFRLVYLMNHENESVLSGWHGIKYRLKSDGSKKTLLCSKTKKRGLTE